MNYNTSKTTGARRIVIFLLIAAVVGFGAYRIETAVIGARAEEHLATCWILCTPGSQVNVRRAPGRNTQEVGFLEAGDSFRTDGTCRDGWVRCFGIGEYGEGWIYCGYVAEEEPVAVFEKYCCVAKSRVACRRWIGGPKTENPWLKNGSSVQVYYMTSEWAVTARGYIRSEYLECDPD